MNRLTSMAMAALLGACGFSPAGAGASDQPVDGGGPGDGGGPSDGAGEIRLDSGGPRDSGSGGPVMVSFQQGADNYAGAEDTRLSKLLSGTNFGSSGALAWIDANAEDVFSLLRFTGIFADSPGHIPSAATIESAVLILDLTDGGDEADIHMSAIPWDHGSVTWDSFGGDSGVQPDEIGKFIAKTPTATGTHRVDVTASLQAWALDTSTNYGWIVVPATDSLVIARSSDSDSGALRPRLTVSYRP